MASYEHNKLVQAIQNLDEVPNTNEGFSKWIECKGHLDFIDQNSLGDEILIHISSDFSFIHTMVVSNDLLDPVDHEDILQWSCNPYTSIATYAGGIKSDVRVERGAHYLGAKTLENGIDLIFGKEFYGWDGPEGSYFELNQEYAHLTDIHWIPEQNAYVKYNHLGDLEHIVSITNNNDIRHQGITLVSFKWEPLERYLAATNSSLIRMFDFTFFRGRYFSGWPKDPEEYVCENDHLFYKQKIVQGYAGYTRGANIIPCRQSKENIFLGIKSGGRSEVEKKYTEFIIHDWRNKKITKVTTNPSDTTNYFDAKNNNLPFEVSPAFFRAEVLLKYKGDKDKYKVKEREIRCRAAWTLRGIDINEAGQVHAYICYLRNLPFSEQQHWASYNENPKTGVSERAIINDFKGEFVDFMSPLQKIMRIVQQWNKNKVSWWKLRDHNLVERISAPVTSSCDEWSDAFMDLSKLIVEGFMVKTIRNKMKEADLSFDKDDKSISLLEKFSNKDLNKDESRSFKGLRTVQIIRSKVKGHSGSSEAKELEKAAIREHETFNAHFLYVCELVVEELELIESLFK